MLPPGMYGYHKGEAGMNPYVYNWVKGKYQRKSIKKAEQLMSEAGYANGVDPGTGEALVLYFDSTSVGADGRPQMNWYRKQFAKLGIKLIVRPTDYNRFQDKMRNGSVQMFIMGWNADYPDPENFFFLLYGPNGKVKHGGENAVNYNSAEFNRLFEQMRNMDDSPRRFQIIQQIQEIIRKDAPWAFAFHPKSFSLYHSWYHNLKPNLMANNTLKYKRIDAKERAEKREEWNQAVFWPLILAIFLFVLLLIPAITAFKGRAKQVIRSDNLD
jgi:ABC-type transport system substrate-binding protein